MNDTDTAWKARHSPPPDLPVRVAREDAANLYNLLCDNARPWNRKLREQLKDWVTATDALNSKIMMTGEKQ